MSIYQADSADYSVLDGYTSFVPTGDASLLQNQHKSAVSALPQAGQIAIFGGGNAARSLACFLSSRGFSPHLLVRSPEKLQQLADTKRITCMGKLEGDFDIAGVTSDIASTLGRCKTIFIATTTNCYGEIAMRLAPYLTADHEVVLFSSKFAGVVEFKNALGPRKVYPTLVETDTIFASRVQDDGTVWIRGVKGWTLFSSYNRAETFRAESIIRRYFPDLGLAENVIQRGLTDFGALAHPITMLANMNSVDRGGGFLFYLDGFTENTIVLMEQLEEEFRSIANAYGTSIVPAKELLNRYYGCDTSSLLQAMRTVPNYCFSRAPSTLQHRFIEEDVSSSLVPMQQLAVKAGLQTPIIDSVVAISTVLLGKNFKADGRTLSKLGWSNLSHDEIMRAISE